MHHLSRRARFLTNLQLCLWRLRKKGSCEPYHHAHHRTFSHRARRGHPQLLFCVHRTQLLIASCAHVLLDFGVSDVGAVLKMQTYCTGTIDSAISERNVEYVTNLQMQHALVVNYAWTDQSFVDICLALECHSIPMLKSFAACASRHGRK